MCTIKREIKGFFSIAPDPNIPFSAKDPENDQRPVPVHGALVTVCRQESLFPEPVRFPRIREMVPSGICWAIMIATAMVKAEMKLERM